MKKKPIPITLGMKESVKDQVGKIEFDNSAEGILAYRLLVNHPDTYHLVPTFVEDGPSGKMLLLKMNLVPHIQKQNEE